MKVILVAILTCLVLRTDAQGTGFFSQLSGNNNPNAQQTDDNTGSEPSNTGSEPSNTGSEPSNAGSGTSNAGSGTGNTGSGTSDTGSGTSETGTDFFSVQQNVDRVKQFVDRIKPEVDTDTFSLDRNPEATEDADVLFILDRSFSVGEQAFESAKCALRNWAFLLEESDIRIRVSIFSFGRVVKFESPLLFESYRSLEQVIRAVNRVPYFQRSTGKCPRLRTPFGFVEYDGCATCTDKVLTVSEFLLLNSGKSRDTATKAIILITDGRSNCADEFRTCTVAGRLKNAGVDIFVHAVGDLIYEPEIRCIATENNFNLNTNYEQTCRVTALARETGVQK